jgi:hypothetical protein
MKNGTTQNAGPNSGSGTTPEAARVTLVPDHTGPRSARSMARDHGGCQVDPAPHISAHDGDWGIRSSLSL